MVKVVYDRMIERSALTKKNFDFYGLLEQYVQWTYGPYHDKDELGKAVERLKAQSEPTEFDRKMSMFRDKIRATRNSEDAQKSSAKSEDAHHLQEVPPHLKERILSSSDCVQRIIEEKCNKGIKIDELVLAVAYSECNESRKAALEARLDHLKSKIENNFG